MRSPSRRLVTPLLFTVAFLLLPRITLAAVFAPMTLEELAAASTSVIAGSVARIEVVETASGAIATITSVDVAATLRGVSYGPVVRLQEAGGALGDIRDHVSGAAQFELGEEVLVFLTHDDEGHPRVNHGALGKFRLTTTAAGVELQRSFGADTTFILPRVGGSPAAPVSWERLLKALGTTAVQPRLRASSSVARTTAPPVLAGRFFEPDDGITLDFRVNGSGDSTLGFVELRDAIQAALAVWSDVGDATITMRYAGLTGDPGRVCPGPNKIILNDPEGIIAPPIVNPDGNDPGACRGELARGIQRTSRFESKSFNGIELERVSCGFLVLADGWENCDVWTACNVAEITTHELGHVIGLGHSSEKIDEADPTLSDATMYFRAHFDGRCAGLRQNDIDGVRFLYPAALPPTITTTTPLPNGLPGMFYSRTLEATGGAGDFAWSIVGGGFPGIGISADGVLSGVPEVNGTSFFQVRAADASGGSHVKVLSFTAGTPGPLPPTATPSATQSPSPSSSPTPTLSCTPTSTPTPTAQSTCPGDCDTSFSVTVDEVLILVSIALGTLPPAACPAGDLDVDGSITVDEILRAVNAALQGCPPGASVR